ncbi:hypothetical protein MKW92_009729 [Papaver armeniacum]|nr:hypothetical protein MKW92_009729 [Papaver armeniacum]
MGCSLNKHARRKKPCKQTFVRAFNRKDNTPERGYEEEIKKLKKESEEKDGRIQRLMENNSINYDQHNITVDEEKHKGKEWQHMEAKEQLRREEAIEKWKRLYLAIKTELDDLIERTWGRGYWRVEDETIEELQREVKAKEETTEVLKARLAASEEEGRKMKTEVDILRQSSRIMSHAKRSKHVMKRISLRLHL